MDIVVIDKHSKVSELLQSEIDFKLLIEFIKPNNFFSNIECTQFIELGYQLVCDILEYYEKGDVIQIIKLLTHKEEIEIFNRSAQEFLSFVKWINNQIEIIIKLSNSLNKENLDKEDIAFQNAGADKLNKYKERMIYYSIDKNPVNWKKIGKLSFEEIFLKLMIDKDINEINKNYLKNAK